MKPINVLSCFDGISAGRLALERAGIPVNSYHAFEIDKYSIKVTQNHYPNTVQLGDITQWKKHRKNIPIPDLIIAGFPCQPYSNAGKRLGLEDLRGQLIYPMLKMIKYFQPEDVLLENVKGFLSIDDGRIFRFLLKELNKCGYAVDWLVINSALVSAQNRERLYIIGKRFDKCKGLVYTQDIGDTNHDNRKAIYNRND